MKQINVNPFASTEVTTLLSFSCKYINRAARSGGSNEHGLAGSSTQRHRRSRYKTSERQPRGVENRKQISSSRGLKMTHREGHWKGLGPAHAGVKLAVDY